MSQMRIPKTITGGCLCGGVRYQIDFAVDHDWKSGVGSPKDFRYTFQTLTYKLDGRAKDLSSLTRVNAHSAERTAVVSSTTSILSLQRSRPGYRSQPMQNTTRLQIVIGRFARSAGQTWAGRTTKSIASLSLQSALSTRSICLV